MRDLWLSTDQVMKITNWSERTLRAKAEAGELKFRAGASSARGRKPREYSAASLPAEFQAQILKLELASGVGPAGSPVRAMLPAGSTSAGVSTTSLRASEAEQRGQGSLFSPEGAVIPGRAFEALTPAQQQQARERVDKIQPMLAWAAGERRVFKLNSGAVVKTLDDLARWLGEQHGIGRATIFAWYASYKKNGVAALADRARSDKGTSRFFLQYPDAKTFVENKFLNEKISIQSTHEALVRDWPRLYNHGSQPPSYETVRAYLQSLPAPVVSMRRGERDFNENHRPFILRDYKTARVSDLWVSDHMQHDVFVYNDLGEAFGNPLGTAFRPYLTDFMDIRSRKLVGYAWSVNPSSESICTALRWGICRYGTPRELYTDNGKDYQSQHLSDVLTRLGIGVRFATKYHAQAKPNESWHKTLHSRLDQKMQPAYCGTDPKHLPDECRASMREHAAFLSKKQRYTPLMPASEFFRLAMFWIEERYNAEHPHRGHGMDRRTPNEVFDMELPPAQRVVVRTQDVADLFWKREKRQLREGGCVVIDNRRYEPADPASFAALNLLPENQREVLVGCDPLDVAEAVAYDGSGNYLGMMRCMELASWGGASAAQIRATKRQQSGFTKAFAHYRDRLGYNRAVAGDMSERDVLRQAAGLGVGSRVVTPEDPMFHAEQVSPEGARGVEQFASRRRALPPAVGSDLAPYIDDVVEDFMRDDDKEAGNGD